MDLQLTSKVAVVTGASKGIGLAITRALAREGAFVVAGARTVDGLRGLDRVTSLAVDLVTAEGPARLVERALGEHGRLDVLVNNVGAVRMRLQGFLGTSDEEFAWSLETNFFSAVRATRAVLPTMLKQGSGSIVNIASVNAFFEPDGGVLDYGAAKAALLNLTKSLAQEFGAQGIRVNAVSPGPVSTDLWLGESGSPTRSPVPPASTPRRRAKTCSQASAESPPAGCPRPRRSRRLPCFWRHRSPQTSRDRITSSAAA